MIKRSGKCVFRAKRLLVPIGGTILYKGTGYMLVAWSIEAFSDLGAAEQNGQYMCRAEMDYRGTMVRCFTLLDTCKSCSEAVIGSS